MNWLRIGTKRALSTAVTSAMLISSVAVMGVTLVGWSQSTLTNHQFHLDNQYSDQINRLNEYAVIENVWFGDSPPNLLNITISNVGTVALNVTEIKLTNSSQHTLHVFPTITDGGIFPKGYYSFQSTDYDWTSSDEMNVVITTFRDKVYTTNVVAP